MRSGVLSLTSYKQEGHAIVYSMPRKLISNVEKLAVLRSFTMHVGFLQAELHGILPVNYGCFGSLQHSAVHWSDTLKQAAAVCHNLSMVNKSTVAGADLDRTLFKTVEAHFLVSLLKGCTALDHLVNM